MYSPDAVQLKADTPKYFRLNYGLFGPSATSFHIGNIIIHTINVLLVYTTTTRILDLFQNPLSIKISFVCAVLFAVHPIHTEAVANIIGRAELLMTTFVLITLRLYADGIYGSYFSWKRTALIAFTALCSLLSKEQGIVAVPLCIITEYFYRLGTKLPVSRFAYHACASTAFVSLLCVFRLLINGFQAPMFSSFDNPAAFHPSVSVRVVNRAYLLNYHLFLLIYPVNLCFDYSMGCIPLIESFSDPKFYITVFSSIGLIVIFVSFAINSNKYKLEMVSLLVIATSFFPASSLLVTVGFVIAERVLYLPSLGFCLLCSLAYHRLLKRRYSEDILHFGLTLLVTFAIVKCVKRSSEWKTEFALYSSGLEVCPNNAKIHYNLGKLFAQTGNWHAAKLNYQTAIQLEPSYPYALNNLANINLQQQKFKDAEELLKKCTKLQPKFSAAWMNLGIVYMGQKQFQKAEDSFMKALEIRPHHADCLYNVGNLYMHLGRKQDALLIWRNVTSLNRKHKRAWLNLLILLDELGKCDEVVALSSVVLDALPENAPIHSQIGSCYGKLGFFQKAQMHLLEAVHLQPTQRIHLKNLNILYSRWNKVNKAPSPNANPARVYVGPDGEQNRQRRFSAVSTNHS